FALDTPPLRRYPRGVGDAAEVLQSTPRGAFVGRAREIAELRAALADAVAGHGGGGLLVGEPGIGKTRLAPERGGRAAARGALVAWGRCGDGGGAPAFWPWAQVLRSCVEQAVLLRLEPAAASVLDDIARLMPAVGRESGDAERPVDSEQQRFRLF